MPHSKLLAAPALRQRFEEKAEAEDGEEDDVDTATMQGKPPMALVSQHACAEDGGGFVELYLARHSDGVLVMFLQTGSTARLRR